MSTRLIIDSSNQLLELNDHPPVLRIVARIISYVFHPVFVPVYILLFLLYIHPSVFAGSSDWAKKITLLQALLMYGFFPIVSVLLLRALRFVNSIYLTTQKDRIIPYVICNIWYFWIMYVWRNLPDTPKEAVSLAAAIFVASVIGLMANIYMKISMHAIAMGVAVCFFILLAFSQPFSIGLYISLAVIVAGLVCTSRFIISNHHAKEIYGGLLAGIAGQLIAWAAKGILY